jgi:hypothetical protein
MKNNCQNEQRLDAGFKVVAQLLSAINVQWFFQNAGDK